MFCCINAIYFSANAFIPIYLTSAGRPDLIGGALTALNFGQLPASLLLLAFAGRLERKAWPFLASGCLSLLSIAGLTLMVGPATIVWAALLGFSDAAALIVGLTLPALLCPPEDVARTSAGMFTLSYGGAVAIAVVERRRLGSERRAGAGIRAARDLRRRSGRDCAAHARKKGIALASDARAGAVVRIGRIALRVIHPADHAAVELWLD